MRTGCEFRPKTERVFGVVQQKPQNDKRARRRYRCDPLGHVLEHAPGAGLALPCLASLLELQDVASLGSETSGLDPLRGILNGLNNVLVTGAPAVIAFESVPDLPLRGARISL